jgi:hypothetical protein
VNGSAEGIAGFSGSATPCLLWVGCVKTLKANFRIEISSQLRKFEKQNRWRPVLAEENRENDSAPSSRSNVFTQPRSLADMGHVGRDVRLSL